MLDTIRKDAESRMKKTVQALEEDLSKQRAGRASPNLLDEVMVMHYGKKVPLTQVSSVIVESALMLLVKPWEKNMISVIEKAIMTAGLGLNPSNSGDMVRVPLPALTEERRKELVKRVRVDVEESKVAIRNIRRDCNATIKDLLKSKQISEDDERRAQEAIQKLTDAHIKKMDEILAVKEKDLMAV